MTLRQLFSVCDTDNRMILVYDNENNVVYEKHSYMPIGKCVYLDNVVAWIYRINAEEIAVRISAERITFD